MRRFVLAAIAAALVGAPPAVAQESPVLTRGELVGGRDAAGWAVAYNRWILHFTGSELTADRDQCLQPPAGLPVTFLATTAADDAHVISGNCTVAAGQYLLLGGPQMECADVVPAPGFPTTSAGLERCARHYWPVISDPHPRLVLDGKPIPTGGIVRPPAFGVTIPVRDNLFGISGVRHGRVAIVGRPTLIKPLAPGIHTLIEAIHYRITHNIVAVYKLMVV